MANFGNFNYFKKINVNWSDFGGSGNTFGKQNAEMFISFITQGLMFLNETSGIVQYSFNGEDVHGELAYGTPTQGMVFDNRAVGLIWFRLKPGSSGPITVSVQAWSIY